MIHTKHLIAATIIAISPLSYSQVQANDAPGIFTSTDLLDRPVASQDGYISVSVGMAAVVALRAQQPEMADCIDAWYSADVLDQRNAYIRSVMQKHSRFHPMGIIIGVIEKHCGSFRPD